MDAHLEKFVDEATEGEVLNLVIEILNRKSEDVGRSGVSAWKLDDMQITIDDVWL